LKSLVQFLRVFGKHSVLLFIVYKHRGVNPGYEFDDSYLATSASDSSSSVWIHIVNPSLCSAGVEECPVKVTVIMPLIQQVNQIQVWICTFVRNSLVALLEALCAQMQIWVLNFWSFCRNQCLRGRPVMGFFPISKKLVADRSHKKHGWGWACVTTSSFDVTAPTWRPGQNSAIFIRRVQVKDDTVCNWTWIHC